MNRRTMLPLVVAAMLIFALQSSNAQLREPEVLPGLLWVRSDTLPGREMMWKLEDSTLSNPTPIITDFEIGWNWTTVPWNVGKLIATRRYHCNDYRKRADSTARDVAVMRSALIRDGIPNMQLIPCVKGIGQAEGVRRVPPDTSDPDDEKEGTNPSETVAMEFAPWLYPVGSTEHFDLKDNDASGAVFGWKTHRRGQPVSTTGTYRMRYTRKATGNSPSTDPVLEDVTPNGELRAWTPWNSPYDKHQYQIQNTRMMEIAVTLRRIESDPVTGDQDDTVLVIEVPYAKGTNSQLNNLIRFDFVPDNSAAFDGCYDLGGRLIARVNSDTLDANGSTKFVITRRMLPAMSDSSEVTLIAKFYCDDSAHHNPKIRDEDGKTADSTEIGKMGITVWHNDDPETGLGVEIRNIRLQTPEAGRLLTGQHDERIQRSANRFLEDLKAMQDTIPNFLTSTRVPPSFKVWMFYGRDEGPKCYWKSYRYINKLLGGRLMTEVNVEDAKEFLHCTQFKVLWQGATPTATPHIATYSYQKGFNDTLQAPPEDNITPGWLRDAKVRRGYANIRYGLGNMLQSPNGSVTEYHDDPDTFQEWRGDTTINGTPTRPALPLPDALVDSTLRLTPRDESRGVLTNLEQMLLLDFKANKQMLFGSTPWLAQVWLNYHMQVRRPDSVDTNFAWFLNNRPRTIGETRTALWLPLILGAKGLMLYRGTTSREGSAAPFDSTPAKFKGPNDQPADNLEGGLLGYFRLDSLAHGSVSNSIDSSWLRSMASGDDWISANDSTYVDRYFYPGLNRVAANLRGQKNALAQDSIYVGTYTGRNVTLDVLKRLHDMRTKLGKGLNGRVDSMPHVLTTLRLESWYGHGFTTISMSRDTANPLARFVDVGHIRERLRTRHPYRNRDVVPSQDIPGHVSYESYDSSFYDITMMSSADDRPMTNSCVISVFNRRTDPRMLAQSTDPGIYRYRQQSSSEWVFGGYKEWADRGPSGRMDQRGARQITIPFNYKPSSGGYKLLRLQEMGGGIDTIIGQDRELAVDFLPGEGKMFRVTVLEGEKPADMQGWLAHNTQRKVVVYPTLVKDTADTIGMSPGSPAPERTLYDPLTLQDPICGRMDTLQPQQYYRAREDGGFRYHIVYHMKADSNALLKVYYRRSQLLASDNNSAASVDTAGIYNPRIVWEEPIALDTFIRQDGLMFGQSANCGYPSLVVRDDPNLPPHMNPCVYVVYACQSPGPEDIAICEARLAANAATHAMQAQLYATMRSSVLAHSKAYPSCPAEYADRLRNWGTPVVGATIGGNFYAWSDVRQGIIVGFKKPEATFFTNGTLQALKMHAMDSVVAQFPSLPSYTKMAIGEDDIPLVWQEGMIGRSTDEGSCTEGEHILYTRLFHNGDTVQHRLVARGNTPQLQQPFVAANNILRITPLDTVRKICYNRKPTVYRQMSEYDDAGMSLSNPLRNYGYVNHKADRIAWEHNVMYLTEPPEYDPEAPAPLPGPALRHWQIDRLSIDCWDSCRSAAVPNTLWHSAISSVYHPELDLRNPELVQGEQKTVLGTQVSSPQIASSWAYGDTSVVLSFNSENHSGMGPHVYHMTFVDGYYRDQAVIVGAINNLGWAALDVTMRNAQGALQGERMPHVAARHSIVHSPSLLKNRRFSESALQLDVSAVYSNALYLPTPDIDRSTRGFFKETDDVFIPRDRIWRGYRSDQFDALLSDILIGGKHYSLLWDDTTTSARMHTAWFDAEDIIEIELKTQTQGASATMAQAKLERQRDGEIIELPVLGVRGQMLGSGPSREPLQYQWTVLTDPNERYRLVLATTDPEALPAEDVEMSAHKEPFARSSLSSGARQMGMIDGYTMRMIKDTIPAEHIHVWPHPATDEVTLMCRTTATSTTPQLGAGGSVPLDIYNLAGELVATTAAHVASNGVISSRMAVSSLDEGFYTIVARSRYPMRGMMVVQR